MHVVFTRQVGKPEWQYEVKTIPCRQVKGRAGYGVVSCCLRFPGLVMLFTAHQLWTQCKAHIYWIYFIWFNLLWRLNFSRCWIWRLQRSRSRRCRDAKIWQESAASVFIHFCPDVGGSRPPRCKPICRPSRHYFKVELRLETWLLQISWGLQCLSGIGKGKV